MGVLLGMFANNLDSDKGHFPIENVTLDEAKEFVRRLSKMTNIHSHSPPKKNGSMLHEAGKK